MAAQAAAATVATAVAAAAAVAAQRAAAMLGLMPMMMLTLEAHGLGGLAMCKVCVRVCRRGMARALSAGWVRGKRHLAHWCRGRVLVDVRAGGRREGALAVCRVRLWTCEYVGSGCGRGEAAGATAR